METWWLRFTGTVWSITAESAPWVLLSLLVGGLVHEFLPTSRFRAVLNRPGVSGLFGAVVVGAMLPICSCGVVPLSVSLYRAGARIGPVMAFTAATPIINPAAVILSLGLLGPQITVAYVALGLLLPLILGIVSERWGDSQLTAFAQPADAAVQWESSLSPRLPLVRRWLRGIAWGIFDLGPSIGFYLAIGILIGALTTGLAPPHWIKDYLGGGSVLSLLAVAVFGASLYVCAVAHIPLVASLLAAGAGPGAAIVFLVTGTATNLPELIALYHTIGKRTTVIYSVTLIIASFAAGLLVNAWLLPDFSLSLDPLHGLDMVTLGEKWQPSLSSVFVSGSAYLITGLAAWGTWLRIRQRFFVKSISGTSACCQCDQTSLK
ncbi:MAG: permease [Burkholderiales bacterium]